MLLAVVLDWLVLVRNKPQGMCSVDIPLCRPTDIRVYPKGDKAFHIGEYSHHIYIKGVFNYTRLLDGS